MSSPFLAPEAPPRTLVKLCGLRRPEDVRAAVERARAKAHASPGALGHTCNDFAPPASTEAA